MPILSFIKTFLSVLSDWIKFASIFGPLKYDPVGTPAPPGPPYVKLQLFGSSQFPLPPTQKKTCGSATDILGVEKMRRAEKTRRAKRRVFTVGLPSRCNSFENIYAIFTPLEGVNVNALYESGYYCWEFLPMG
jgi:hypothetical protein